MSPARYIIPLILLPVLALRAMGAPAIEEKPDDAFFEPFQPVKAPAVNSRILRKNDRLAICGDSITEQKMYSRIMETYLTVCVPEMNVTVRQYGWGGEKADGFLKRMTNDCLRFQPTIATTCYGMNDHGYRAYTEEIGERYRNYSTAVVRGFRENGVRMVLGSPGCVSKKPRELNLSLCELRNIDIDIARQEKARFADVFWPMLTAGFYGQQKYGTNFHIAGGDGVHPDWPGHLVMAYSFLKSFGLDGNIGTYALDWKSKRMKVSDGHALASSYGGVFEIRSSRYPFCATNHTDPYRSIRTGMALVPFNRDLNRLTLMVRKAPAGNYRVSWGNESKSYSAEDLAKGVNLAEDFAINPFTPAFTAVDAAVKAKQDYETRQVKQIFHGPEGKANMDSAVVQTEQERDRLAQAIRTAFVPVSHTMSITAQ